MLTETPRGRSTVSARALLSEKPTAKRLILSLLSQPNMPQLSIRQLIAWGELFDQNPSAIRVTAGRLVKESLLKKSGRGMYMIGPGGLALKQKAGEWVTALDRIRDWQKGWFWVHISHLGKAHRPTVRARERAFRLLGFKEFVSGLWVRPDNLTYSASQMHAKLCDLGLEPRAAMMRSDDLVPGDLEDPLTLWSSKTLNAGYAHTTKLLNESQRRLERQDLHTVTRESFLIGEYGIRQINADPLLPSEYIDAEKRAGMVKAMVRYSDFCHAYWKEFLRVSDTDRI